MSAGEVMHSMLGKKVIISIKYNISFFFSQKTDPDVYFLQFISLYFKILPAEICPESVSG